MDSGRGAGPPFIVYPSSDGSHDTWTESDPLLVQPPAVHQAPQCRPPSLRSRPTYIGMTTRYCAHLASLEEKLWVPLQNRCLPAVTKEVRAGSVPLEWEGRWARWKVRGDAPRLCRGPDTLPDLRREGSGWRRPRASSDGRQSWPTELAGKPPRSGVRGTSTILDVVLASRKRT